MRPGNVGISSAKLAVTAKCNSVLESFKLSLRFPISHVSGQSERGEKPQSKKKRRWCKLRPLDVQTEPIGVEDAPRPTQQSKPDGRAEPAALQTNAAKLSMDAPQHSKAHLDVRFAASAGTNRVHSSHVSGQGAGRGAAFAAAPYGRGVQEAYAVAATMFTDWWVVLRRFAAVRHSGLRWKRRILRLIHTAQFCDVTCLSAELRVLVAGLCDITCAGKPCPRGEEIHL